MAPFFKAALEGGFKEAENASIEMPKESPYVIQRFQLWAYTGQVLEATESLEDTNWQEIIGLYFFADSYDLPDLQNATMDTMVAKARAVEEIPLQCIPFVYDNTNAASPLRRFLIDWMTQRVSLVDSITVENLRQNLEDYPPTFLLDLAVAFYKLEQGITRTHSWGSLGCIFHVHPNASTESKRGPPKQSPIDARDFGGYGPYRGS